MKNNTYRINIIWSKDDNAFIATCPEFIGLSVVADSREEALQEAQDVLASYIEIYKEDNKPLPEPNLVREYSGQIRLRVPKSLHNQASEMAADDSVSLNSFIVCAIQAKVSSDDVAKNCVRAVRRVLGNPQPVIVNNFRLIGYADTSSKKGKLPFTGVLGDFETSAPTH